MLKTHHLIMHSLIDLLTRYSLCIILEEFENDNGSASELVGNETYVETSNYKTSDSMEDCLPVPNVIP